MNWFCELVQFRGLFTVFASSPAWVAYKAGVYLMANSGGTNALTATEDLSKFVLLNAVPNWINNTAWPAGVTAYLPHYMKARSN